MAAKKSGRVGKSGKVKAKPKKTATARVGRKLPASSNRKIRLLASKTLTSLDVVTRQLQGLASHGVTQATLADVDDDGIAKRLAVYGVVSALIEKRANPTFLKKGWEGTVKGDYNFTETDLPPFLDLVSAALLPKYHFEHDDKFDRTELADTLGGLTASINLATKA